MAGFIIIIQATKTKTVVEGTGDVKSSRKGFNCKNHKTLINCWILFIEWEAVWSWDWREASSFCSLVPLIVEKLNENNVQIFDRFKQPYI